MGENFAVNESFAKKHGYALFRDTQDARKDGEVEHRIPISRRSTKLTEMPMAGL